LRHGVPMVCLPLGRRSVRQRRPRYCTESGGRLAAEASPDQLRSAIGRVMTDERFKQGAIELGTAMAFEGDAVQRAADEIEFALRNDDDNAKGASSRHDHPISLQ
jgi:UDP:flavonoid glycosyltransferase YjiC (YdhE family)